MTGAFFNRLHVTVAWQRLVVRLIFLSGEAGRTGFRRRPTGACDFLAKGHTFLQRPFGKKVAAIVE